MLGGCAVRDLSRYHVPLMDFRTRCRLTSCFMMAVHLSSFAEHDRPYRLPQSCDLPVVWPKTWDYLKLNLASATCATLQRVANEKNPSNDNQAAQYGEPKCREFLRRFASNRILELICLFDSHTLRLAYSENTTEESVTQSLVHRNTSR